MSKSEPLGSTMPASLPAEIVAFLVRSGLLISGERPAATALTGGVSSDIWRVDLRRGPVCVKRALSRLKVAAEWRVPVDRNAYEVAWLQVASGIVPEAVPRLIAHDAGSGMFAMEFLDPHQYRIWKEALRDGMVDREIAAEVGRRIVRIHAGTADDSAIARRFPTDAIFHAIRLEPYLEATAKRHPDLASALMSLSRITAATKRCLVHGDVSPKNILLGPRGPVFLDAECAWFGDPAFDLAFCLNHVLLKCLWVPSVAPALLDAFDALAAAYFAGVTWEPPAALEARTARLLPGLFLARIDGKSPVEYVTLAADKDRVRRVAGGLLARPVDSLSDVRRDWARELGL